MQNPTLTPYLDIANQAMSAIWNRSTRDFQKEAIPRLLMMRCVPNVPSAMLLVQGTGGGKSAVPQTVGVVTCGITLIIENTLSLSADQHSKIKSASSTHGPIKAFHLDSIKTKQNQTKLYNLLTSLPANTNSSIFIFTSPECLLRPLWKELIPIIINKGTLRLVCVDEVHQFVMFGLSFRPEFCLLKQTLFKHIMLSDNANSSTNEGLKVPLLFMTATFNKELLQLLQMMIGIRISPSMFLWGGRNAMQRRTVKISLSISSQCMKSIKSIIRSTLHSNLDKKIIIYTNTSLKAEAIKHEIDSWLNLTSAIQGDTIIINGDLESEVKLMSAIKFTEDVENPNDLIENNKFYPRILVATSSCIGTGLDSSSVYSVIRIGFPTSTLDLIQEMGRCGRNRINDGTNPSDNFHVFVNLNDFIYLNERLYVQEEQDDTNRDFTSRVIDYDEQRMMQRKNMLNVLELFYLKKMCWHYYLECQSGSPLEPPNNNPSSCKGACPFCLNETKQYILPVSRIGVSRFLAQTFINTSGLDLSPMNVVKLLHDFKDVGRVVYGRPRSPAAPQGKFVQSTILQLIASGLIVLKISDDKPTAICSLSISESDFSPHYLNDLYWENFNLI